MVVGGESGVAEKRERSEGALRRLILSDVTTTRQYRCRSTSTYGVYIALLLKRRRAPVAFIHSAL